MCSSPAVGAPGIVGVQLTRFGCLPLAASAPSRAVPAASLASLPGGFRAGASVVALRQLLGHSSIATTQGYVDHLELGELGAAVPFVPGSPMA